MCDLHLTSPDILGEYDSITLLENVYVLIAMYVHKEACYSGIVSYRGSIPVLYTVVKTLPASADHLEQISTTQSTDLVLQMSNSCQEGWVKHLIKGPMKSHWYVRGKLSWHNA